VNKEKISLDNFKAYERVKESSVVNMVDIKTVARLSGLFIGLIINIMKNYKYLTDKHNNHIETEALRKANVL